MRETKEMFHKMKKHPSKITLKVKNIYLHFCMHIFSSDLDKTIYFNKEYCFELSVVI